ncbi:MAG: AAA family ATPase, partial [Burkholderiales bacterium]|nr:AAA family ATPase [Burkholderiales bacterium]
ERGVKGLSAPVLVWQLRALRSGRTSRLGFVGRQAELAQLGGVLASVRNDGTGVVVVVRGDAGIGKSRLVEEYRALAAAQGFDTVCGQVLDFGVAKGQDAVPSVLKAWLAVAAPQDEAARRGALQAALADGLVAADEELFIAELLDLAPSPAQKADFDALDNATRLRRSGEALGAVARRAAQRRPRLVCIEDVHWASADLRRHLAALAREAAQAPIVLVLSSRIEGDPLDKAWRAATHGCTMLTLDLAPLRAQDARLLARSLVDASSRFALQCIERAEGNPLFLEQLLRGARDSDTDATTASVPPTIQSLVLERMDRLPGAERSTLQAASVIGKRFALADLRAIGDDPQARCDALLAADLVRSDGRDYQFAHALIQEAVYGSTLKSRRRDWHLRAAEWFGAAEPVLHAEHLDRADDRQAVAAYLAAAQQLAERLRYDGALDLAARGLARAEALGAQPAVVCALALLRGDLLREAGRSTESIAAFDSALGLAASDDERCQAWLGLAHGHRVTGEFTPAMQALEQAQPIAERLAQDDLLSQIHNLRGNLLFAQGRVSECEAQHALALACALRCESPIREVQALSGLGDAHYAQGRMGSALAQFRRCVEMSEAHGWIRIEIPNRCMVAFCLLFCGEGTDAMREAGRANEDAERIGVVGFAGAWLCGLRARCADHTAEREQALHDGEAMLSQPMLAHSLLWFHRDAIDACVAAADWPRVRRYADALEAFVNPEPLAWARLVAACGRALADVAQGPDRPAASQRLRQLRDDAVAADARWLLALIDAGLPG